jgi:hypothetical protein
MLADVITRLNAIFPPLPRWRLGLLLVAAVASVLTALSFLERGAPPVAACGPGLVLLVIVWLVKMEGRRVGWWLVVATWGSALSFIACEWLRAHWPF